MASDPTLIAIPTWRDTLPTLEARLATLREPRVADVDPLVELLSLPDASRFGLEEPVTEQAVAQLIERAACDRAAGVSFTFAIALNSTKAVVGLAQVRQLDPAFEAAEWDITIAPSARGSGVFIEAARLIGSFAFGSADVHRLEARALAQNGRANGALRKLGAVQEGILRRSIRRGTEYLDQVMWSSLKEDWSDLWLRTVPRTH